jgi:outer membrane protein OmpA-like peptidoglycan-associated protein
MPILGIKFFQPCNFYFMLAKSLSIVLLTALIPCGLMAQNNRLKKNAEKDFYENEMVSALSAYQEILETEPDFILGNYRAEICSLLILEKDKSLTTLFEYERSLVEKDRFFYYWLGKIHAKHLDFENAIQAWNDFLALDIYKSQDILIETNALIEAAKRSLSQTGTPIDYEVDRVEVDAASGQSRLSPNALINNNSLIYLSGTKNEYNVQISEIKNGVWGSPTTISHIGTVDHENSFMGLVETEKKTFLYGNHYYSVLEGETWQDKVITAKSPEERHSFINAEETRMIFSAKTTKSKNAQSDLFEIVFDTESGKWRQSERLEGAVNTLYDEDYPFLSKDGKTLYFSSKGHGSFGGFDIFKSEYDAKNNSWSIPLSLNLPVNSNADEIHFEMNSESGYGYFASNRNNSQFDIYQVHSPYSIKVINKVVDQDGNPIPHVKIKVFSAQLPLFQAVNTEIKESGIGFYKAPPRAEMTVDVYLNNQLKITDTFVTPNVSTAAETVFNKEYVIQLEEANTDDDMTAQEAEIVARNLDSSTNAYEKSKYEELSNLGSKFRLNKKAKLSYLYFGYEKHEISGDGMKTMDVLVAVMNKNKDLKIEIAGHTDNSGSAKSNMKLSKKRAQSIVDYLVSQGINPDRLIAKGYGESNPIASNDDEIDGRQLNRRIEVIVIE